ncbi:MAG TPA: hypothetical protein VF412_14930 [Bdellovibrio sp.]|uniref:hypothetical protein n=1 Tax=Bdellovibrio sp. TaxID=28201 RepID=UPI002F23624E
MLKSILIGTALLLATSVSHAALGGEWNGWGDWTFQGSGAHCDTMKLQFNETQSQLQRVSGYFDCGITALQLPEQTFQKNGKDLLVDGQVVGSVEADTYKWTERYSDTVKVQNLLQVEGHHMTYTETWIGSDGQTIYVITGRLFFKE